MRGGGTIASVQHRAEDAGEATGDRVAESARSSDLRWMSYRAAMLDDLAALAREPVSALTSLRSAIGDREHDGPLLRRL